MVHTVHPVWGNRSCLRFGIYSEALDEDLANRPKINNTRLRCCVVAGMILVTALLVGLMVYDMLGGHGASTREKDALQHLVNLTRTTPSTPGSKTTVIPTFATTTTTTTVSPNTITTTLSETTTSIVYNMSQPPNNEDLSNTSINYQDMLAEDTRALPYTYATKENNRRSGKQRHSEPYDFVSDFPQQLPSSRTANINEGDKENYQKYWLPSYKRTEIQSKIMNHGIQQVPRPFRPNNYTTEKQTNNRNKIIKNDVIPYYGFTSLSKYPQLSSYRYPNEAKNIQDIIKYLTAIDSTPSPTSNNMGI
ncbi:hypothetical protein L9F63_013787 [Diploptera punctata]|uniref:Uncharacterized protein n=1 Tax=Diploptera punctata TaxID=6984 RepID=A0AAD8EMG1_DIPPU|nr:hypothetical protein L9F63_013787 [Diploptera punctata]